MINLKATSIATCVLLAANASADIYKMTMSGTLTEVIDNRTAGNDDFAGTAWSIGNYLAQVGHTWTYTVYMDTDAIPEAFDDQDPDYTYSIYGADFDATLSLNGIAFAAERKQFIHFESDDSQIGAQIWGSITDAPVNAPLVFTQITGPGSAPDLINDGNPFTDVAQLAGLTFTGFSIFGSDDDVFKLADRNADIANITIERVPAPSSLLALSAAGLFTTRRRR